MFVHALHRGHSINWVRLCKENVTWIKEERSSTTLSIIYVFGETSSSFSTAQVKQVRCLQASHSGSSKSFPQNTQEDCLSFPRCLGDITSIVFIVNLCLLFELKKLYVNNNIHKHTISLIKSQSVSQFSPWHDPCTSTLPLSHLTFFILYFVLLTTWDRVSYSLTQWALPCLWNESLVTSTPTEYWCYHILTESSYPSTR